MQKAKLEMTAGLALAAAAVLFIAWGVWKAVTPEPVPLQGMMDARTVSVAAKVPGRLGEVTVEEGTLVKAGDTVARLLVPEIEAKVAQAKAAQTAAGAQAEMAEEGSRVQAVAAAKAAVIRAGRVGERAKAGRSARAKEEFGRTLGGGESEAFRRYRRRTHAGKTGGGRDGG